MKRQNVRKLLLILSLLLFPITMYYFSPYLIISGAIEGIVTGSFIVFVLLTLCGIFFGRAFCAYVCPMGGLQECLALANEKRTVLGWRKYIKYGIWIVWIGAIIACFLLHGKLEKIDAFYMTEHGISISEIGNYIIYYLVIILIVLPALIHGKRAFCHYFCWIAPFMVIGTKIRKLLHIKGLHLEADKDACISCKQCTKHCPMSLEVEQMVKNKTCNDSECILCGECVDHCPKKAITYKF